MTKATDKNSKIIEIAENARNQLIEIISDYLKSKKSKTCKLDNLDLSVYIEDCVIYSYAQKIWFDKKSNSIILETKNEDDEVFQQEILDLSFNELYTLALSVE